jgi:triacylglycerol lipase
MRQRDRLRVALAIQWGAGALVGACWFSLPWWLLPPAGVALAGLGVALVLGAEFLMAAMVDPAPVRGKPARAWSAWAGETIAHLRAFWLLQPFRADFERHEPAAGADRPAVLLIHGFSCNRAVWLPLLASGRLSACNVDFVDLAPACGSIEGHARQIEAAVGALRARTGARQVSLIAHSMGGLAALAYLRRCGHQAIRVAVAIAVPFGGTFAAHFLACPAARQMRPGNRWLSDLVDSIVPTARDRILCIASRDDNIIVPRAGAVLPGARHVIVGGAGHLALTCDPAVWTLIGEAVGMSGPASHRCEPGI